VLAASTLEVLKWVGIGCVALLGIYMAGLMIGQAVLIFVGLPLWVLYWLRRTYRVLVATKDEFDGDGLRLVDDERRGSYYAVQGQRVYPLPGTSRTTFSNAPRHCVTRNRRGFHFCNRQGRPLKRLPVNLRDADPADYYPEHPLPPWWSADEDDSEGQEVAREADVWIPSDEVAASIKAKRAGLSE
jgi:hypothetical protein